MADNNIDILAAKMEVLHQDVGEMKTVLRELTSAIAKLAVVEERQAQTAQAMERAFKAIEKVESRVSRLEETAPLTKQTNLWIDRLVVGVVTAVLVFGAHKIGLIT